jgi:uncharacterized RDD family membrane protein YckC
MIGQYWATLEIEPTDDRKAIKKAYARKLKFCKPDKDPEEFKKLREAYEYLSSENTFEENQTTAICSAHDVEISQDEKTPSEQLIHQLYLLAEDDNKRKILDSWKNILTQVDDFDIQEKRTASLECFQFLLEYAEKIKQGSPIGKQLLVPRVLVEYFDNVFYWSQDASLEMYFEEEEIEQLIALPKVPQLNQFQAKKYSESNMHTRAVMALIDIVICVVPAIMASVLLNQLFPKIPFNENETLIACGICIYLIYSFCFEMSKWKGSVGKRVAYLQILNKKGERSTVLELLWRSCLKLTYVGTVYIIYFKYEFTGFVSGYVAGFVVFHIVQLLSPAKVYQIKN